MLADGDQGAGGEEDKGERHRREQALAARLYLGILVESFDCDKDVPFRCSWLGLLGLLNRLLLRKSYMLQLERPSDQKPLVTRLI